MAAIHVTDYSHGEPTTGPLESDGARRGAGPSLGSFSASLCSILLHQPHQPATQPASQHPQPPPPPTTPNLVRDAHSHGNQPEGSCQPKEPRGNNNDTQSAFDHESSCWAAPQAKRGANHHSLAPVASSPRPICIKYASSELFLLNQEQLWLRNTEHQLTISLPVSHSPEKQK